MQSRPRRRGEDGLTLIEMIVTIAIITIAVVGITGAVASTERLAAVNQSQANLEVAMRQVADFVRDSSPQGLTYHGCESLESATSPPYKTYNDYISMHLPPPANVDWAVSKVYVSIPNGDLRNGTSAGVTPVQVCNASTTDFGVQEIQVKVCDYSCSNAANRSLSRIVWKSKSW
jgi:prepilin-type N-terminal cleavage/methylation domain-containing protein